MNKLMVTIAGVFFSTNVFASTLRIPLFLDGDQYAVSAAEINHKLKAVGAPLLPLYYEISNTANGPQVVAALDKQIANSLAALGADYKYVGRVWGSVPSSEDTANLQTCYTGNPEEVIAIVGSLADVVFSDQLNIFGYKYKNKTVIYDQNGDDGTMADFLNERSLLWKNWKVQGENLLILASVGDSGDDVNESLIKKCK